MRVTFPVVAEARGEGMLLRIARAMNLPGMSTASIDGGSNFAKLSTSFRRARFEGAMDTFKREMLYNGFHHVDNLREERDPTARTYYRASDQVYIVITYTPRFYSVNLIHRATTSAIERAGVASGR